MARRTREEQQRHNRLLLLQAAERIFSARGVEGASLDDVALEAGLTKGAVYSNFRSKGELILEVIKHRQTTSQEAQDFRAILDRAHHDDQRLQEWCDTWVSTARSGERVSYARLVFDFIPYALRNPEFTRQFADFITPPSTPDEQSPIPSDSKFQQLSVADQFRIMTALDLGLSVLLLFDPDNVDPGLYKSAVLALARTQVFAAPD